MSKKQRADTSSWLERRVACGCKYNRADRYYNRIFIIGEFRELGYITSNQEFMLLTLESFAQYRREKGRYMVPADVLTPGWDVMKT